MNIPFMVTTPRSDEFGAAVFAMGVHAPIEFLDDIENDLRTRKIKGKILFDLLPANGVSDRFFVVFFDGQHFMPLQFKSYVVKDAETKAFAAEFYKENAARADFKLLSKATSFMIRRGVPL
jgi:hypothetical protein